MSFFARFFFSGVNLALGDIFLPCPDTRLTVTVRMHHDGLCGIAVQTEAALQNMRNEVSWCVVVIQQNHRVERGLLWFDLLAGRHYWPVLQSRCAGR